MRTAPVIRHPDADELRLLYPDAAKHTMNLDQVWAAFVDGDPAAGLILWDGGHSVVRAGSLIVREAYRHKGVGLALLEAVKRELQAKGRTLVIADTASVDMAYWAKKKGALVGGPLYVIHWEV